MRDFVMHALQKPIEMIEFINEILPKLSTIFPEKGQSIHKMLIECGNVIVYQFMADKNSQSVIRNVRSGEWEEICQLLLTIYPLWDFPSLIIKCLAESLPLKIKKDSNNQRFSLALGLYSQLISIAIYARSVTIEEIKVQEICKYLNAQGFEGIALMLKGWNRHNQGEMDIAINFFESALKNFPDFAPAQRGLASSCFKCNIKCNLWEKALQMLEPCKDPQAFKIMADWYYKQEKYGDALVEYEKILECDINPDALFARAICFLGLGEYSKAEFEFNEIIRSDSEHLDAISYRAYCYWRQHRQCSDLAFEEWQKVLSRDERHLLTLRLRTYAFEEDKNFESAILDYNCILEPLTNRLANKRKKKANLDLNKEERALAKEFLSLRMQCYLNMSDDKWGNFARRDALLLRMLDPKDEKARLVQDQLYLQKQNKAMEPQKISNNQSVAFSEADKTFVNYWTRRELLEAEIDRDLKDRAEGIRRIFERMPESHREGLSVLKNFFPEKPKLTDQS